MSDTKFSLSPETIAKAGVAVALFAVSAWVTVPIGPVPVTMQTMALAFIVCALDGVSSGLALVTYIVLGALGVPVFSGMRGGVGVLFGATGGYLLAFTLVAFIVPFVRKKMAPGIVRDVVSIVIMLGLSYALGTIWLAIVGGLGVGPALAAGTLPFIIPDCIKSALAIGLAQAVTRVLPQLSSN